MRQVLFAREEPNVRSALPCDVVANRAAQRGVACFERVKDGALRNLSLDVQLDLAVHAGERTQRQREQDAYHGSACTSTDSTAGRSRTMGAQLSPASGDA